jgi:hypothetical protein
MFVVLSGSVFKGKPMISKRQAVKYFVVMLLVVWVFEGLVFAQNNLGRAPLTSPRIVNLDNNPATLKIVAGDEAGNLNGFDGTGRLLWQVPLRINGFPTSVQGTPAVADMDGDGLLEIVVTTGNVNFQSASPGGVILLRLVDAGGFLPPLQKQIFVFDNRSADPPDNVPHSSIVSPALGDLNGDGILDIVVGSFDQILRAMDINGNTFWSDLVDEQGVPTLYNGIKTGDTIFSSPVIANIDNDPQPEVILGIEANDARPCAAAVNFTLAKPGGGLLVIDGKTGKFDTNTPFVKPATCPPDPFCPLCPAKVNLVVNIDEVLNSTPALADINNDGRLDIVFGTGRPFKQPPFGATNQTVFAYDTRTGRLLWSQTTGGFQVPSSPAVGDVDGDGILEVFVRSDDDKLYGFKGNTGALLPGFPVTLDKAAPGTTGFLASPVLGDVNGDGIPEIIVVAFGKLNIVGAKGTILSSTPIPNLLNNTPAVGDIDGDGRQEIVVEGANIQILQQPGGSVSPWPQFKANARGTGLFNDTGPGVTPQKLPVPLAGLADYNGDNLADIGVFTPSTGQWFIQGTPIFGFPFGLPNDIPTPGDYNGDRVADLAVWRPSTGEWHLLLGGSDNSLIWGQSGDIPVPKDYDGDQKTDLAVWRPSNGNWYVLPSGSGLPIVVNWGVAGDIPVPADYDGDGKTDIAVFRSSTGQWFILNSGGGIQIPNLGKNGDIPVPADYDGDTKANVGVWRPSTGAWIVLVNGRPVRKVFGAQGDLPVPADFDGDGKTDLGIFNTSFGFGVWYLATSSSQFNTAFPLVSFWGLAGDLPVSASGGR